MNYKKTIKLKLFISIIILIAFYVISLNYLDNYSKEKYLDDKVFKSLNMKHQLKKRADFIIIGSSKVQYNFSSNLFKQNGLEVYNYGKSGMVYLYDFPYVVKTAVQEQPKNIILSVNLKDLYTKSNKHRFLNQQDVDFILNDTITSDFKTLNEHFFSYIRLQDILHQLSRSSNLQEIQEKLSLFKSYDKNYIDCNITNISKASRSKFLALCSNGDAIYLSNIDLKNVKYKKFDYKNSILNENKIELLNKLIAYIKENGINPIILIEPFIYNKEVVNHKLVLKEDVKIIDMVNFNSLKPELWGDKAHYNEIGRYKYTQELLNILLKTN